MMDRIKKVCADKRLRTAFDILVIAGFVLFGFYVNRDIVIKGLYMDDLYMWSCYGEQSFFEYVFPIGTSTRFRPVYWLTAYIEMGLVGNRIELFVPINIICNAAVAALIYFMAKKISGLRAAGIIAGIMYLSSRFAYYQIGQVLGLMETEATFMALLILFLLYLCLNDKDPSEGRGFYRYFNAALLVYFLIVFVHERYLALLPLFYLVLFYKRFFRKRAGEIGRRDRIESLVKPAAVFFIIYLIRKLAIGTALPAGTGGTEVTDTFKLYDAFMYAVEQVFYIFGVNAGPEHLNGVPWDATPVWVKVFVKISVMILAVIVFEFLLSLFFRLTGKEKEDREKLSDYMKNVSLFILFIAMCIGCSSVTIRVEMRWIYVSFAAALLLCGYMIRVVCETYAADREEGCMARFKIPEPSEGVIKLFLCAIFAAYALIMLPADGFYRSCFPKLYFWADQLRMNSLAEETYGKYGDDIFGRKIYILENSYGMSDFYKDTFFKTFDPERKAEGTEAYFADSVSDIPREELESGNILVIEEAPEENAYRDITDEATAGYKDIEGSVESSDKS